MNTDLKLIWRVDPAPTGRYRSFQSRSWPTACHGKDGPPAVQLSCPDEYQPADVKTGNHGLITVFVAEWHTDKDKRDKHGGFTWRRLTTRAATLDEAKNLAAQFFKANPHWVTAALAVKLILNGDH